MKDETVIRDERTIMIENASYRWGYLFVTYGLLVIITLRAFFQNQTNWDLMALVVISGLIATAYQGVHHIFTRRWVYLFAAMMVLSAVVAGMIAFLLK